jgi:hypothetical protein
MDALTEWVLDVGGVVKAAALVGVTRVTMWRWMNGKSMPGGAQMVKLFQLSGGQISLDCWMDQGQEEGQGQERVSA